MKVHSIYIAIIIASFILGVRMGGEAFYTKNAQFEAAMTVAKLKYLQSEKYSDLESVLNFELDNSLLQYVENKGSILHLVWPELKVTSVNSLEIAATYRKNHPNTLPEKVITKELGENAEEYIAHLAKIEKIANEYGK